MDLFFRLKKSVASLALVAMAAFLAPPVAVTEARLDFSDTTEIPSWATEAIEELMGQGVIQGNDDGSFAPNRQLNRAEVSKIIVLSSGVDLDTTGGSPFPDVSEGDWFYDYVITMYNYGWINGYPDGLFRPGVGINRAEIAKMVVNAFELEQDLSGAPHFDDTAESDWFYGYVETAYNNGLMRGYGDGTFGPANAVTRAETVKIVYDAQLVVTIPSGPAEGTLEVRLSDATARATTIPFNAVSVPYTTLELTASDDSDVEVSSLTITRLGLGDNDDFDNVWIEVDGFKIGNDKSVNNDDISELRFNPPMFIAAGQTIQVDFVASSKYTATDKNTGHHNRFALVSADDIVSTAENIVGDFPIEGEEMEVADYQVSQVRFSSLGSDATIDVGDIFVEIGKFRLENASFVNKDIEFRALTFKNDGTAELEDTLENVALYVSGEQVSAETIIDGDYITFRLDNGVTGGYVVEDGDSRIFSIRADIVSAEEGDSLNFKIDNFEDIVAVEIGTSFGVKGIAGGTGFTFSNGATSAGTCTAGTDSAEDNCARLKAYTLDAGDLNVSRDPASLGNQEYAPGSNDVVFMTARLIAGQPLLLDGVQVQVSGGATGSDVNVNAANSACAVIGTAAQNKACFDSVFDNFRLFINDKLIDSENSFSGTAASATDAEGMYLDFNTTFELAGTSILKLVGNISSDASDNDQLKFDVAATNFLSPEYISTGDQVQSTELLGTATSSFAKVLKSQLTITKTDGLSDGNKLVAGSDDIVFNEFVLDNNDSGDVNVTSVTVKPDVSVNTTNAGKGRSGSARTGGNYTLAIFVDGTQQGSAKNFDATSVTAAFNDINVVIPSAGQKEFTVVTDTIESSATAIATIPLAGQNETALGNSANVVVGSTTGMTVGDLIVFDNAGTDIVRAITAVVNATTLTLDADIGANIPDGSSVTIRHQIKFDIIAVDADNVENGSTVTVLEGGVALSTANPLEGTLFVLVGSGTLKASLQSTVFADVLVEGEKGATIMKVQFNAADDEVHITDLYFENDIDNDGTLDNSATNNTNVEGRIDFELFNEAGQMIQRKQMISGVLHFQLQNQKRIRVPKDGDTFVTIKGDVRSITRADQTGKRLRLSLDGDNAANFRGVEAITAATGDDIDLPTATPWWESVVNQVTSQEFVLYKTNLIVEPASTQPSFSGPNVQAQEMFRFTVSADAADQADVERLTMDVTISGMRGNGNAAVESADFSIFRVDNGIAQTGNTITDSVVAYNVSTTTARVVVDFTNETVSHATPVTYALFVGGTEDDGSARSDDDAISVTFLQDEAYDAPTTQTLMKQGTTPAASSADGTTTTIIVPDTEALAAGIIDADDNAAQTYTESIGRYAIVTDAVTAANSRLVKITNAVSDATDLTVTFTPAVGAATANVDNDTIVLFSAVVWSDESDPSHSASTSDWLNGFEVGVNTSSTQVGPY